MPESILEKLPEGRRAALVELAAALVEICSDLGRDPEAIGQTRTCVATLAPIERAGLVEIFKTAVLLVELVELAHPKPAPAPRPVQ